MKKIFTLFAALMMVLSMSAATKTIYCKMAQSWWKTDGAAVGAYAWKDGGAENASWPGVRMTKVDGETDLWSIDIDTDKYNKIIFTRVNASGTIADWGAKTADQNIPTDDKNLFTITSTSAVWGDLGCTGTWSTFVADAPKTYKDITITVTANATPKIHYWEGGDKVVGTDWENLPTMTAAANPNEYTYTIKDVDEATGVKYLIVVGDIQSADQLAFENVNKNFKELLPQVSVMGVTGWEGDKMTVADDYLSASVTLNLKAATDYELKLTVNGQWYGSNAITITKDKNSASFAENGEGNGKLTTDLAGDYVFTYTYATKTLVVTYPVPTPTYTVTVSDNTGGFEPLTTGGGEYEEGENATVTASEEVEGWVFVGWMENEEFVANDPTYTFEVEGNTELVAVYAMVMEEEITNLVIDTYMMALIGGPSINLQVEVFLGLSEDDGEGGFLLSDESSVSIMGQDATWIDGRASVDMDAKTANAIVVVELGGIYYALSLTMSTPSAEPTNVVVVNAVATYDEGSGALKLTGLWEGAEVFIEIAGYDGKESVEYNTPQGIVFETPDVVAFGNEAEITVAGEDITVVCEGLAPMMGSDVYNVTITTLSAVGTALDNVTTTVAPAKAIVNGQLVIVKDGVKYNAQGAVVK